MFELLFGYSKCLYPDELVFHYSIQSCLILSIYIHVKYNQPIKFYEQGACSCLEYFGYTHHTLIFIIGNAFAISLQLFESILLSFQKL